MPVPPVVTQRQCNALNTKEPTVERPAVDENDIYLGIY